MEQSLVNHLKAVFVISSDQAFSDKHPLWNTIQSFRSHFSEIHLVVFTKVKIDDTAKFISIDDQLFVYYVRRRFLLLRLQYIWTSLQFNLRWRNYFQPDLVISYTDGIPALIGYLLAWRNKKKFFMEGSSHFLGQSRASLRFLINRFLLKRAEVVFVPGAQTADSFTTTFLIPPAQLVPVKPPFDLQMVQSVDRFDLHVEHDQYNFFISSVIYFVKDVSLLIAVHKLVQKRYARIGMIILVDASMVSKVKSMIKHQHAFGIFVYEQNDSLLSHIAGSQVYVAISTEQDIDIMMVKALGVHVPVITKAYGIAQEMFIDTMYERYMVHEDSAAAIATQVLSLIEDARQRTEYMLNTEVLLSRISFTTVDAYTAEVSKVIESILLPAPLQPVKPIADLAPFVPEESKLIKPNEVDSTIK